MRHRKPLNVFEKIVELQASLMEGGRQKVNNRLDSSAIHTEHATKIYEAASVRANSYTETCQGDANIVFLRGTELITNKTRSISLQAKNCLFFSWQQIGPCNHYWQRTRTSK